MKADAMRQEQIAYIGTGQMARAWAQGLVRAEVYRSEQICGLDPDPAAAQQFTTAVPGARVATSAAQAMAEAEVVVIATKPQQVAKAAAELRPVLTNRHLVISIAAGMPLRRLTELLATCRVVRVMPNTPCLVGFGASAYALGPEASESDGDLVEQLLMAVGSAYRVDEYQLDAVTGLSGSGPAFVYLLIEALSDGGVGVGLPRKMAAELAAQTVRGAAEMVLSSGEHPGVLKDRVTSPGGTTIAGLQVLEQRAVRGAMIQAVAAAAQRAREMGEE